MDTRYYIEGQQVNLPTFLLCACREYTKGSVWTVDRQEKDGVEVLDLKQKRLEKQPVFVNLVETRELDGETVQIVRKRPKLDAEGNQIYEQVSRENLPADFYLTGDW